MKNKRHCYCKHSSIYEIPFFDVDPMFIMWYGHYVKYLEMARCAFLEEINYTYDVMKQMGFTWPIVQLNLKYIKPATFRQKIRVDLSIVEYESCLRINYIICDNETGEKLTQGSTTQVAVDVRTEQMQFQTPDSFRQAVENFKYFTKLRDK